jgi:hypothetical protein
MAMNNFNTGRDLTLNIVGYQGTIVSFPLLTGFDAKQSTNNIKIKGMDGVVRFLDIPDGWSGTLSFERQDATWDTYFSSLESDYYSGVNIQAASITETMQNPDGSTSQYRFTGVMFKYDDAGSWMGDKNVPIKLSWSAGRRIKVQ